MDDMVHFDDLVDITKVVHKSKKEVAAEGYDNVITYYELRDADIPIIRDLPTAPPAGIDGRTFDRPMFPDKLIKRKGDQIYES